MEKFIEGKNINLRDVEIDDADFLLKLRTDEKKSRFLNKTENDLQKQIEYIKKYKAAEDEYYFIIEAKGKQKLGCFRIYDIYGDSFCIGSWIIADDAPEMTAIESIILIYEFGFSKLGYGHCHFDVRKENRSVQRLHEMYGARKTGETELDYLYGFDKVSFIEMKRKFQKFY
jgi:RimJ/RimL family protein N-acetyltransferase